MAISPLGGIWLCLGAFFGCNNWGVLLTDTEDGGTAEHPTMCRAAPKTKNYLVQNVNSAETEKPASVKVKIFRNASHSVYPQLGGLLTTSNPTPVC